MEPLRGSGSEGSEGSARFQRAGSKGVVSPAAISFIVSVTYLPSRLPPVILSASEGSRYLPIVTQKLVNTSRREADSRKPEAAFTVPLSHSPTSTLAH